MQLAYTIVIIPGEPDEGGYWVKVPALPGCVTQDETIEEAIANAREAISVYLWSLKDRGLPITSEGVTPAELITTVSVEV